MRCRHCGSILNLTFADLGSSPLSNAYLTEQTLRYPEKWFPLRVLVCESCWLVQAEDYVRPGDLFTDEYAYFSGVSKSWLAHCENYVISAVNRYQLNSRSHVVEIGANDGHLLQYVRAAGIPCTGVEPSASTAAAARAKGIEIVQDFFGVRIAEQLVKQGKKADLTIANNVLAHVPDINDFVSGITMLLKADGIATFEFPHLPKLISGVQFDTIYHEHYSYLSLKVVDRIFTANGLTIFDVEEYPTHGGSLRVHAQRSDSGRHSRSTRVDQLLRIEEIADIESTGYYINFQSKIDSVKNEFLNFLLNAKQQGKITVAYGAAAKGNTLLNYAGIRPDLIRFVMDRSPSKQGKYMPGSRIPILGEELAKNTRPDYVVILPWNLKTEIVQQLFYIKAWGASFVTAIPHLELT